MKQTEKALDEETKCLKELMGQQSLNEKNRVKFIKEKGGQLAAAMKAGDRESSK